MRDSGARRRSIAKEDAPSRNGAVHLPDLDIGPLAAVYPPGNVRSVSHLVGVASAAMVIDYERGAARGTWFSPKLHYFDMTLSRRPKGAFGRFIEGDDEIRPVGSILFVPAGFHYSGQGGPGRQKSLALVIEPARLVKNAELEAVIAANLPHCMSLQGESLRGLLKRIEREVIAPGFGASLLLDGLSLSLLVETARALNLAEHRSPRKGGLSARNLRIIEERAHASGPAPTLAELAALCQLSERHLVRTFRTETGQTVGEYLQGAMLERAQDMLATSTRPISEIAGEVGFTNAAAFSTAFRRMCGQSPRSYRVLGRRAGVTR